MHGQGNIYILEKIYILYNYLWFLIIIIIHINVSSLLLQTYAMEKTIDEIMEEANNDSKWLHFFFVHRVKSLHYFAVYLPQYFFEWISPKKLQKLVHLPYLVCKLISINFYESDISMRWSGVWYCQMFENYNPVINYFTNFTNFT